MRSTLPSARSEIAQARKEFWIAPRGHLAINRLKPTEVPQSLSVIVATSVDEVQPVAFTRPVASLVPNDTKSTRIHGIGARGGSGRHGAIPPLFKAQIYVWKDTTIREIFEEVLRSTPAAALVLLPPSSRKSGEIASHTNDDMSPDVSAEDGTHKCDSYKLNGRDGTEDRRYGDEANGEHPAKRVCTEAQRGNMEMGTHKGGAASFSAGHHSESGRRPAAPAAKVCVFHVYANVDRRVQVQSMTVLRTDKPSFHTGDFLTMKELRTTRGAERGWRSGDLLVFAPSVQHYCPP
ncbi:hypothetical protein, conserved [Trypanosoma brucei gambiense DAL972]|uniref:Uncharacterized protein n=2 Tax=Trypanosoma brucei TaxID=5691 RepID=C9ZXW2_TRYB9|nr:hypothetical protein, conserved [Trypanosoma brucei gambiense DAL972]RHW70086.1 hypothetical protein DPX39_090029700 [Trypanosoma brucei equiperdum]CBH14257.1 hypothetical protein, conserved [Trypanosoma brucei gambiense DAL972]|eukprot:XP_011776527.1 hypothetical protein, conserved [Trypanosoma brucei gambiense DAL972]